MPGYAPENLPQITRFLAGLVTNRNPIDTPFSIVGLNIVQHHDALNDGLNMEISAYNTLVRRPGFSLSITAPAQPRDFFFYKELSGTPHVFVDYGGALYVDANTPVQSGTGGNIWSVVGAGNFVFATNGVTPIWMANNSLNVPHPMGLQPLQQSPTAQVNTTSKPYYLSDFIPDTDAIGGSILITDTSGNRTLTITITNGNVHFNVTLLGLPISPIQDYTQTDTQTVAGATTTDVYTQVSGFTGTVNNANVTNGTIAYYPGQGTCTMDFDMTVTATLTIPSLVYMIDSIQVVSKTVPAQIPEPVNAALQIFVLAVSVEGQVASSYYPDTSAVALLLTANGL